MDDPTVRIGHNKGLGIAVLCSGGLCLGLGLLAGTLPSIGIGTVVSVMGLAYLFAPMAVVHDTEVELKNVWGMTLKRHSFADRSALTLRDGNLLLDQDGTELKLLGGFTTDKADLARLQTWLTNR